MKTSKPNSWTFCVAATVTIAVALSVQLAGQTAAVKPSGASSGAGTQWSIQVERIDPGNLNLAHSFQVAIYENLLEELNKTKRFKYVLREGDSKASEIPDLLILKTMVVNYTPGSETQRAVTTVRGATKLTVRSQLLTRDGEIVLDRTVQGNVRFFGSNLRATHNLARNIAKVIKRSNVAMVRVSYCDTQLPTLNADGTQRSGGPVTMYRSPEGRP
ncbi:MAG: hypothetical protein ABSG70_15225 [Terriglobales bacterium]|jgi:hypothetical protein